MKLGIFFSKCDGIVGTSLDLDTLAQAYKDHPAVVCVKIFESFYNTRDFDVLLNEVQKNKTDAIILAGDSPMTYRHRRNGGHIFKRLSEAGVNRNRLELVNLKNMVAMPHQASQEELQLKAKLLTDIAIARVRHSADVKAVEISPRKAVAIIGANLSSIAASQLFLDEGYKVFMIHQADKIKLSNEESVHIHPTLAYVASHPRFFMFNKAVVKDFYGFTGDYTLEIKCEDGAEKTLPVGAAVLSLDNDHKLIRASQFMFHIDIDENGVLVPRDRISAPSQTEERGILVINPAPLSQAGAWERGTRQIGEREQEKNHSQEKPDDISYKFLAADAAAAMVINLLNKKEIYHRVTVSQIKTELCSGCGACVKTCIFKAVSLQGDPPISVIDPRRCRGCGNCVTACPADARDLEICPAAYMFNAVEILSKFTPKGNAPLMLLLACDGCGYQCLDQASEMGLTWPVGVMPLWVKCGGQIDMQLIMHAFVKGFDSVVMMVCGEGCCHNMIGNVELERRINLFREVLASRGIDHNRLHVLSTCSRQGKICVDNINKLYGQAVK